MKKPISLVLVFAISFAGCAGREANPVQINQFGDEDKTCEQLKFEMNQVENEIGRLLPKSDKTGKNIALAATGILFVVPLFFMDLKQGEKVEIEAYRRRYNHLTMIFKDKGCKLSGVRAESIPSFEEQAKALTNAQQITTCANCGEKIGTLEKKYTFETYAVCAKCYEKLKSSQ